MPCYWYQHEKECQQPEANADRQSLFASPEQLSPSVQNLSVDIMIELKPERTFRPMRFAQDTRLRITKFVQCPSEGSPEEPDPHVIGQASELISHLGPLLGNQKIKRLRRQVLFHESKRRQFLVTK